MNYPSIDEVLVAHESLIAKYGGTQGVRDFKLLESAVFRCQASFGGEDLYKTVFEKAAATFHGIIFDHPFLDGNKRTATTMAASLLAKNGWLLSAMQEQLISFPLAVEKTRPDIAEIAKWFKKHCRKRSKK